MISLESIPKELYGVPAVKRLIKKLKEQSNVKQKNRPASTDK